MPINIGSSRISPIYLGSSEITKVYLGSQLVYQKGASIPDSIIVAVSDASNRLILKKISTSDMTVVATVTVTGYRPTGVYLGCASQSYFEVTDSGEVVVLTTASISPYTGSNDTFYISRYSATNLSLLGTSTFTYRTFRIYNRSLPLSFFDWMVDKATGGVYLTTREDYEDISYYPRQLIYFSFSGSAHVYNSKCNITGYGAAGTSPLAMGIFGNYVITSSGETGSVTMRAHLKTNVATVTNLSSSISYYTPFYKGCYIDDDYLVFCGAANFGTGSTIPVHQIFIYDRTLTLVGQTSTFIPPSYLQRVVYYDSSAGDVYVFRSGSTAGTIIFSKVNVSNATVTDVATISLPNSPALGATTVPSAQVKPFWSVDNKWLISSPGAVFLMDLAGSVSNQLISSDISYNTVNIHISGY